jgi:hypothetical protein
LKQTKIKNDNLLNKNSLYKKNRLFGDEVNKNIIFNTNNKNRVTKKKMIVDKNIKITLTNGNINSNQKKAVHLKNKTFDFNQINQTNNNFSKNNNIIITEEYNTFLNKKIIKNVDKINTSNNSKNKINYHKINKPKKKIKWK